MVKKYEPQKTLDGILPEMEESEEGNYYHKEDYHHLSEKAERLEKALEFYANKDNWQHDNVSSGFYLPSIIIHDKGEIARNAIKKEIINSILKE